MLVVDDAGLGREKEGGANFSCPPVDSRQIWDQWDSCGKTYYQVFVLKKDSVKTSKFE